MTGPVETAIRANVASGETFHTPARQAPFIVDTIDGKGIVLLLGKGQWATRLTWDCLEGIIPYIHSHGGEVKIGGQHSTVGTPGTLDAYLKDYVKRTTAGWVAVVLAEAGIVELVEMRPMRIRLNVSVGQRI